MPNASTQSPRSAGAQSSSKSQGQGRGNANPDTDTDVEDDEVFALVSVLYHSLQGASAARKYISDARAADDEELVEFFQRCREDDRARAKAAKSLLVSRVDEEDDEAGAGSESGASEGEEDEEDEEDEDAQ